MKSIFKDESVTNQSILMCTQSQSERSTVADLKAAIYMLHLRHSLEPPSVCLVCCSSKFGMGHGIFSGHNSFNVTMRLAGCHIDVILKLQRTAHKSVVITFKMAAHALSVSHAAGTVDHEGE